MDSQAARHTDIDEHIPVHTYRHTDTDEYIPVHTYRHTDTDEHIPVHTYTQFVHRCIVSESLHILNTRRIYCITVLNYA
jgi:hypothetical protein